MQKMKFSGVFAVLLLCFAGFFPAGNVSAAPYAALVMDARTGKVLHSRNADTRLHPASLTKMMTLYIAFEAIERGEISLDTQVKISRNAAAEPPSKLGLRAGQRIKMRYLIRAAAVKSANDAATAIAEAISGSEKAFARRMTATAKAMGMRKTTFHNPHGLTQKGHLSTARDMAVLGRRLFFDHRDYYNLFKRMTTSAGTRRVNNTNRRFLGSYRGADGIKTGYTRAAGYNLVGSAVRGNERIIAAVFGGKSSAWRNGRMAKLLDMGFARAPTYARTVRPKSIGYIGNGATRIASAPSQKKRIPNVKLASRPVARPNRAVPEENAQTLVARAVMDDEIENAVQEAVLSAAAAVLREGSAALALSVKDFPTKRPLLRSEHLGAKKVVVQKDALAPRAIEVARGKDNSWSVHLGVYANRREAERLLLVTALQEVTSLDGAYRKIEPVREKGRRMYRARFVGLTRRDADRACARLSARNAICVPLSPGS